MQLGKVWWYPWTFSVLSQKEYYLPALSIKIVSQYLKLTYTWEERWDNLFFFKLVFPTRKLRKYLSVLYKRCSYAPLAVVSDDFVSKLFAFTWHTGFCFSATNPFDAICKEEDAIELVLWCYFSTERITVKTTTTFISFYTVGRRLLTLLSFKLIPPNVDRWRTREPSVDWACEITVSICTRSRKNGSNEVRIFENWAVMHVYFFPSNMSITKTN